MILNYTNTFDDILNLTFYLFEYKKKPYKITTLISYFIIIWVLADAFFNNYFSFWDLVALIIALLSYLLIPIILKKKIIKTIRLAFINNLKMNETDIFERKLIIEDPEETFFEVITLSPEYSNKNIYYSEINYITMDNYAIYIFIDAYSSIIIPFSSFESSLQKEDFLEFLNIKTKKKIKKRL